MNPQGSSHSEDRPATHPGGEAEIGRRDRGSGIGDPMRNRYFFRAKTSRPAVRPENPAGCRPGVALSGDFLNMQNGIPLIDETGQIHDIHIQ
jgi:hypothetical protein